MLAPPFKDVVVRPDNVEVKRFVEVMTTPRPRLVKRQDLAVVGVLWKSFPDEDPPSAGSVLSGDVMQIKFSGVFPRGPPGDEHVHCTQHVRKLRVEDGERFRFDYIALEVGVTYVLDRRLAAEPPADFLARVARERNSRLDDFDAGRAETRRVANDKAERERYQAQRLAKMGVSPDDVGTTPVVPRNHVPVNPFPREHASHDAMNVLMAEDAARVAGQEEVLVRSVRSLATPDVAALTVLGAFPAGGAEKHRFVEYDAACQWADVVVGDMYGWGPWPIVGVRHAKHMDTPYCDEVGEIVNSFYKRVEEVEIPTIARCAEFYRVKAQRSKDRRAYWEGLRARAPELVRACPVDGGHEAFATEALVWAKGVPPERLDAELAITECAFLRGASGEVLLRIDDRDLLEDDWADAAPVTVEDIVGGQSAKDAPGEVAGAIEHG